MQSSQKRSFQIAMDGPVAAGKGTVARLVSNRLGLLYVDTGAMYRMTVLLAQEHHLPIDDEAGIVALLQTAVMDLHNPEHEEQDGRLITTLLNGADVSWKIRTPEVSVEVSKVAVLPGVRRELVKKQQKIAEDHDVVMEGRDITFKVLPNAQLKIYLTASVQKRAERRHFELQTRGQDISLEQVMHDLEERDQRDMGRETDPLHVVKDAWVLDTTELTIDEVVDQIVERANEIRS